MNKEKLICTHCKSEDLTYLPDVFGQSWVRHYYKQTANGDWQIVAQGSTPKKNDDTDNVNRINRRLLIGMTATLFSVVKVARLNWTVTTMLNINQLGGFSNGY
jgi:hypothetical protein